ncbi:MAG: hypothetical protein KJ057_15480 [Phycisphaerae bacterium]|nr:hypothetical protein [Planctomycetia bacterium]MCL4719870.1 hypothetical protein [Phycisphaerae bacterium]
MFRHKIVTKRGALAAIAGIVVVSAGMGVSRATGPEPTPTMTEATLMMPTSRMTGAEPMAMAMLAPFTWTGNASNAWNNAANWSGAGVGYPDDSSDDATFSGSFGFADFDASRTIDDLTVDDGSGSYFQSDGENSRTLTCDTVVISGDTSGDFGGVHVTGLAGIETN